MRRRRAITIFIIGTIVLVLLGGAMPRLIEESLPNSSPNTTTQEQTQEIQAPAGSAREALEALEVKGRAPKTGYERSQFGDGWDTVNGCTTRNIILYRDLLNPVLNDECKVVSGTLVDSYSGEILQFSNERSAEVQIDHIVALSDAWQKGAQNLTPDMREQLANDPLELLAVSGAQNQAKSDGDAATWLPKNKLFRCEYVARQIAVKKKYALWVTEAEKTAIVGVLASCPEQALP